MRRINQCFNTRLLEICQRADKLTEFHAKLDEYLPPTLQKHCRIGSFNRGCLMILVDDPVWASELRYCVPELRDTLRQKAGIYQLTSIKVVVATEENPAVKKRKAGPQLTDKARDAITASSYQCTYQPLKQALFQLANSKKEDNSPGTSS